MSRRRCKATSLSGKRCRFFAKYGEYCHSPAHRIIGDPAWVRPIKLCPHPKTNGDPCGQPAGHDTPHVGRGCCKDHGGTTPNHIKKAQREGAEEALVILGVPRKGIRAEDVLQETMEELAGNVDFYRRMVRAKNDPDELVWTLSTNQVGGAAALPHGAFKVWAAAPSIWIDLYNVAIDKLVNICRVIIGLGLEKRRVELDETRARFMEEVLKASLADWGVKVPDPEIRKTVAGHILRIVKAG